MLAEPEKDNELRLWYRRPAAHWLEALPLGNGRLGAMVFGGVAAERLVLNEDTMYAEEPGSRDLPLDITKDFDNVLGMIRAGDYAEADAYVKTHWLGRSWPCYQPLGDLYLRFGGTEGTSEYVRELDLTEAVARVRYTQGRGQFEREYFASQPDNVVAVRLKASGAGRMTFRVALESPHPNVVMTATGRNEAAFSGQLPGIALRRTLEWVEQRGEQWKYPEIWNRDGSRKPHAKQVLYGAEVDGRGMKFEARVRAMTDGGRVVATDTGLSVEGAGEAVLLIAIATSFNGVDKSPSREGAVRRRGVGRLWKSREAHYEAIRAAHVSDYKGSSTACRWRWQHAKLPTDQRIPKYAEGTIPAGRTLLPVRALSDDRQLAARYQPMNLQGLWNRDVIPPWAGSYTTNINSEMNYWPAEVANLTECVEPLERLMREPSVTGRRWRTTCTTAGLGTASQHHLVARCAAGG